jgi:protein tyrosine phosphatase
LKRDPVSLMRDEFERLNRQHHVELREKGDKLFASALAQHNVNKNRYADILAMEHSRVRLMAHRQLLGEESDYINANYIDGQVPGSQKAYIACQAPLPSTLGHFWLMLWVRYIIT